MDTPSLLPTTLQLAFTKIRTQTNSGVAAVRRPATLLTAIDSTLSANGTKDLKDLAPTAYLVALVSTLQQLLSAPVVKTGKTPKAVKAGAPPTDKEELLEATLYLLSLLAPHLDEPILRSQHSLLPLLSPLYTSFATHAPALKSLLAISQSLLASLTLSQLSSSPSSNSSSMYRTHFAHILKTCSDSRPKVRRRAQEAVIAILAAVPAPAVKHPWAGTTAGWAVEKLEEAVKGAKRGGRKEAAAPVPVAGKGKKGEKAAPVPVETEQGGDESRAIALLTFVKNLGTAWDDEFTPALLPLLLSTLTLSSPHLTLATLTLLSHLFSASLSADSLSANHVEETLAALVGARPKGVQGEGEGGEKLVGGWVEGVGEGMVAFARTNPAAALNYTATLFPSVIPLLASATTPALRQAVESSLELMIKHCVPDSEVEGALVLAEARGPIAVAGTATPSAKSGKEKKVVVAGTVLIDLIELIEKSLTSPRYAANALPHVLGISESLFLRLRLRSTSNATRSEPSATILLSKLLLLIGHQREEPRFEWKREADVVLSTATKVCGPAHLLALLPLGLTTDMVNPTKARAWLLPLLKPSITNTSLAHFKSYWVPLSAHLFSKAEDARKGDGGGMEAKVWETLVGQIWSLLSGYCEYSTDLIEAFDTTFVSLLGNILYTQSTLRPPIFKALSTLLTTTSSLASSTSPPELLQAQFGLTPAEGQLSLDHLRTLSTDILSMSFNVYAQQPRGEGAYIIDCITNWFSILSPSDLVSTYTRISTLLTQALAAAPAARPTKGHGAPSAAAADENIPPTHALLDILLALIPHAPASSPVRKALFGFALGDAVLGAEDAGVQKKGYRILARLLEGHEGVVDLGEGVGEVLEKLVEGREQVAQGAKRDRTLLLSTLVPLLPPNALHHIPSLIPEAVLGTKESNERTRSASYDLLVQMGTKMTVAGGTIQRNKVRGMEDGMDETVGATVEEFIEMVSAGLAGSSPHMISATITSLSRLVFEFHTSISHETLSELLTTLIMFLSSANREIVRSAVGYVKVTIVSLPSSLIQPSLSTLIPALINWSHEHSNHFKVKIRHILERLVRKFGVDEIEKDVPEEDKKLITNIRKRQMRSKKKKAALAEKHEGDEDMDDAEPAPKPQAGGRSAYDDVLYGSDSDFSGGSDDDERATAATGNRKSQTKKNKARDGAFIHEDDDEVLDLLDDKMMSRISASRPTTASSEPKKPLESHFKTDEDGRMHISEDVPKSKSKATEEDEDSPMGAYLEAMRGEDGHSRNAKGNVRFNKTQGKRHRGDIDDDNGDVTAGLSELDVGGGKKKKMKKESVKIGAEFKAKHAGGDVKKNGIEPYSYVPLSSVAGKQRGGSKGPKMDITGHKKGSKK